MNKVFSLLALSFIILPNHLYAYKYGLGSCLDQDLDQPIWSAIKEKNIDILNKKAISFGILNPTKTALEKSIIDAIYSLRVFLKEKNFHDYEDQ